MSRATGSTVKGIKAQHLESVSDSASIAKQIECLLSEAEMSLLTQWY